MVVALLSLSKSLVWPQGDTINCPSTKNDRRRSSPCINGFAHPSSLDIAGQTGRWNSLPDFGLSPQQKQYFPITTLLGFFTSLILLMVHLYFKLAALEKLPLQEDKKISNVKQNMSFRWADHAKLGGVAYFFRTIETYNQPVHGDSCRYK